MFFNQSKAERAARIRVAAQQLNFSYVEQSTLPHFLIATDHSVFNHHKQYPTVENVLYCQSNGVEISLFDYTYSQQRYSTNTPYAGRTETFNQTIASLRKGLCHQSVFYKYQQLIEPENIRMFLDEAFKAYNHELFIQSYRDRARFHLQVEVLSVQERVPLLDCKPFNVSVKARVVRILRGDESLRVGDAVMFTLTVAQEGKSGNSIVPKSIRYSKLLEAGFLEVFLNGQPPNCHVPLVDRAAASRTRTALLR
jgi:hypothetical protein